MTPKVTKRFSLLLLMFIFLISILSGCSFHSSESPAAPSSSESDSSKPVVSIHALYTPVTFDDLLEDSTVIVYGEISRVLPAKERPITESLNQVYTPVEITPIETLKGTPTSPFTYNYVGGEFEGKIYQIEGDTRSFHEGDRVFVFLSIYDGDIGPSSVFIEHNGMLTVWDEEGNETMEMSTGEYISKVKDALTQKGL